VGARPGSVRSFRLCFRDSERVFFEKKIVKFIFFWDKWEFFLSDLCVYCFFENSVKRILFNIVIFLSPSTYC